MLITKETDYALRLLRALLDGEKHTVAQMAQSQEIPFSFAYQILRKLSEAGLVQVFRGQRGGCRLAEGWEDVSLKGLMEFMGDRDSLCPCTAPDHVCSWRQQHGGCCCVHTQLQALQDALTERLSALTLRQLLTPPPGELPPASCPQTER